MIGCRVMHTAQLQIDKVLEEAALVAGAGRRGTFVKITLRVLMPALLSSGTALTTGGAFDQAGSIRHILPGLDKAQG